MTLKEFLEDYASEETKKIGMDMIARELLNIPTEKIRNICKANIDEIAKGKRDFRF